MTSLTFSSPSAVSILLKSSIFSFWKAPLMKSSKVSPYLSSSKLFEYVVHILNWKVFKIDDIKYKFHIVEQFSNCQWTSSHNLYAPKLPTKLCIFFWQKNWNTAKTALRQNHLVIRSGLAPSKCHLYPELLRMRVLEHRWKFFSNSHSYSLEFVLSSLSQCIMLINAILYWPIPDSFHVLDTKWT